MSKESQFQRAVLAIIKDNTPVLVTEGEVTAVDKTANTCTVDRGEMPELLNVRLNCVLGAGANVITVYPSIGSKVLCILIENNPTDAYLFATNNIDEAIINGGGNGGLTITPQLVANLNKMSARVDGIIDAITNGVPVAQDGGAALQASIVTALEGLTDVEDFGAIENTKIKH